MASEQPPAVQGTPPPRTSDEIKVQEHHASTTVIRKIRLALFKNRHGE